MNLIFKTHQSGDSFTYLYVSGHRCDNPIECEDEFQKQYLQDDITGNATYHRKLLFYLDLASFLTAQLKRYVLLNYSPVSEFQNSFKDLAFIKWQYEFLSDNNTGMGVDHGFVSTTKNQNRSSVLAPIENLRILTCLPEALFLDASTNITLFGLLEERTEDLVKFMNGDEVPVVDNFLQKQEVFIHLKCGKEYGHFNAIIIKSNHDLKDEIAAYQGVLDADN